MSWFLQQCVYIQLIQNYYWLMSKKHLIYLYRFSVAAILLTVLTYLFVLPDWISKGNKTWFKFIGRQSSTSRLIKVVKWRSKFIQLFLRNALWVPGQNLVFHLIDGSIHRCNKLFPSNTKCFHSVLRVSVFKHEWFLERVIRPIHITNSVGTISVMEMIFFV